MVASKTMFVTAAVLCALQLAAAECDANAVLRNGVCECNVGTACTTCSCGTCITPVSQDAWGCEGTFASYNASATGYQCVGNLGSYCDAPSRDQSYSSFRSGCTSSSTQTKYLGSTYCADGWQCDTGTFGRCSGTAQTCSGTTTLYGPSCSLDDSVVAAFATVYIIVIICLCCCFVIGPIVLCFFMGYACFAAGAGAGASNQNNQNNMEMQNRAQNPGAPPAYPAQGPAP